MTHLYRSTSPSLYLYVHLNVQNGPSCKPMKAVPFLRWFRSWSNSFNCSRDASSFNIVRTSYGWEVCTCGCDGGIVIRKLRSPRKNRCDVEYMVVGEEEGDDGSGGKRRVLTM